MAMRLQTEPREIAAHRALGDAAGFGCRAHAPEWVAGSGLRGVTSLINSATCASS
jgi:hypothetical protein